MAKFEPRINPLGMREQATHIRRFWSGFRVDIDGGRLQAEGRICPHPLMATYNIRLSHRLGEAVDVWVLSPELAPREPGGRIPHMYGQRTLCLHLPDAEEWNSSKKISDTVLPWTSLWLSYYERWHVTGVWEGGGAEPHNTRPRRVRENE